MKRSALSFNPARFASSRAGSPGWRVLGNSCRVLQALLFLCLAVYGAHALAQAVVSAAGLF